jgi:hypothetical protein
MLGLLLAPVFAVALMMSLGLTLVLVKDGVEAGGEWDTFEAQMRHYTDRLELTSDGSLVLHRTSHPVYWVFATFGVSWMVCLIVGYLLEQLRRNVWSSASPLSARPPRTSRTELISSLHELASQAHRAHSGRFFARLICARLGQPRWGLTSFFILTRRGLGQVVDFRTSSLSVRIRRAACTRSHLSAPFISRYFRQPTAALRFLAGDRVTAAAIPVPGTNFRSAAVAIAAGGTHFRMCACAVHRYAAVRPTLHTVRC